MALAVGADQAVADGARHGFPSAVHHGQPAPGSAYGWINFRRQFIRRRIANEFTHVGKLLVDRIDLSRQPIKLSRFVWRQFALVHDLRHARIFLRALFKKSVSVH